MVARLKAMTIAPTAQQIFQMLENESLWDVAKRVHTLLVGHNIDHAIVGGLAVFLHGYRRNTVDLDLLIRPEDATKLRSALEAARDVLTDPLIRASLPSEPALGTGGPDL